MEMKAIQGREKRWARRGRLLSLFSYLPLRICMSLLRCPEWSEKERENSRENEKYNRKLALVGRVVAKERKIEKQKRRGRLLSLFGCLPLRICMSFLRYPEKRRRGTEGWGEGPRKWI